ncbi:hypothetical protein [Puniceicoccus vermicola]|uniref:Uncharacterized protein n=1 Tax=Puniceicoccus vermicola TaxID=388746 RepID=A0A7X1E4B6_9BACT|nr:hypothetical protein [Puniceicoccus vermicola]MBC2600442.1 hypothetical protein [Puniceicoccus vermicola]
MSTVLMSKFNANLTMVYFNLTRGGRTFSSIEQLNPRGESDKPQIRSETFKISADPSKVGLKTDQNREAKTIPVCHEEDPSFSHLSNFGKFPEEIVDLSRAFLHS